MLRYKADRRTLAFVGIYFALFVTAWLWNPSGLGLLIIAPIAVFSFFGAVATHNALHSPPFKSRGMNRFFQVVLSLTYGHPVSAYVPGHNLSHHRYTQSRRDVMRTSKVRFSYNGFNLLLFMPRVVKDIMRADTLYVKAMYKRNPTWFKQYLIEWTVFTGTSAALLILDWKRFLLFWMAPHMYAAWGIVTMNFLQHDGTDADSEYNHSRNFVGKAINWFTYNNGFHTLHHMVPGMHWSLLPEEHAKQVAPHIHPALDQPSMLAYCFRNYVWPGKRVRYDGKPVVLPLEGPDESWIPAPNETPEDVSLGAVPG